MAPHTNGQQNVEQLLAQWRGGDGNAMDQLFSLMHGSLKEIAVRKLRKERGDHTLQATALVNEAYLQMADTDRLSPLDQAHFRSLAARVMRNILVDYARSRRSQKRGGDLGRVTLSESRIGTSLAPDIMDLDDALTRLRAFDARKASVVELNFFGGLTYDETAAVLEISAATVDRELRLGKAWLTKELGMTA